MADKIIVFAQNDVYQLENFGRMSYKIQEILAERKPAGHLMTMAGDFIAPSFLSSIDKGHLFVEAMNQTGFTHACIGNHEFDLSVKTLLLRIKDSKFKVVNSNISSLEGSVPSDVVTFKTSVGEFRVGLLGFCTAATKRLCLDVPHEVKIDPIKKVFQSKIDDLRSESKPDFVITLTHQDQVEDEECVRESDVDLVLGGHDHNVHLSKVLNKHGKAVPIVKVGMDAVYVGVITIDVATRKVENVELFDVSAKTLPVDPDVELFHQRGQEIAEKVKAALVWKIPLNADDMDTKRTSFATFLLTKIRIKQRVDCVITNAAFFKGKKNFENGFSLKDLHMQIRWGELVLACKVPGQLLQDALAWCWTADKKLFLYMQCDDGLEANEKNEIVKIAGRPFNPSKLYKVLLPSTLIRGDELTNVPILVNYFKSNPRHLHYDPAHESPTLLTTVISSLIVQHWKDLFNGKSFEDLDLNHDGVIDVSELQSVLIAQDVAEAVMNIADIDKSGGISKLEWDAERTSRGGVTPAVRRNIVAESERHSEKVHDKFAQGDINKLSTSPHK